MRLLKLRIKMLNKLEKLRRVEKLLWKANSQINKDSNLDIDVLKVKLDLVNAQRIANKMDIQLLDMLSKYTFPFF